VTSGPDRRPAAGPGTGAAFGDAYTFGDTDAAARRLRLVDEVFGPASRTLLADVAALAPAGGERPRLAYDLGCGPGHTTALVARETGAERTIGLDSSAAHIARAQAEADRRVGFARHDVRTVPFPAGPADLIYGRLLLAHIPDPTAAVLAWASQLRQDGLVMLDEIEWIETDHPILRAHLDLAEALVATTGATMCAGPRLAGLAAQPALRRRLGRIREVPVPTARAAAMFAMNIAVWSDRPVSLGLCKPGQLTDLAVSMAALTQSTATGEITWGMHQAAYTRSG
jgi:trans-aconitate 2-methyltransferase